jgi:hypothetical protein
VLTADLMAGNADPRPHAPELLKRALAALPAAARTGRIRLRADAGYFAGTLARAAHLAGAEFAIGAKRIAPLWRLLHGLAEPEWTDALDMPGAQVAVAAYCPDWWPAATRLLIRRVRLNIDTGQVSPDPRTGRRRTLRPDQRAPPIAALADLDAVYGYSFIVTNLDVSTPDKAAATEHWYRHRTELENIFRDAKLGAALRHLPSGYPQVNAADVGSFAHGQHRRLAAPAHRHPRTRRAVGRSRHPQRPSHDRHPAPQADPRASPPGPSRRCPRPAPTTGTPPAPPGPRPPPQPPSNALTRSKPQTHRNFATRGDTRTLALQRTRKPHPNTQSNEAKINPPPTRESGQIQQSQQHGP